jgi:hypothetical protein
VAAKHGHEAVVRHILEHQTAKQGGDDPDIDLQAAIMLGLRSLVEAVIHKHGPFFARNPDMGGCPFRNLPFPYVLESQWRFGGLSHLSFACALAHVDVARVLIKRGASVHAEDFAFDDGDDGNRLETPPICYAAGLHNFAPGEQPDKVEQRETLVRLVLKELIRTTQGDYSEPFDDRCVNKKGLGGAALPLAGPLNSS